MEIAVIFGVLLIILLLIADAYFAIGLSGDLATPPKNDTFCERCKAINNTVHECVLCQV